MANSSSRCEWATSLLGRRHDLRRVVEPLPAGTRTRPQNACSPRERESAHQHVFNAEVDPYSPHQREQAVGTNGGWASQRGALASGKQADHRTHFRRNGVRSPCERGGRISASAAVGSRSAQPVRAGSKHIQPRRVGARRGAALARRDQAAASARVSRRTSAAVARREQAAAHHDENEARVRPGRPRSKRLSEKRPPRQRAARTSGEHAFAPVLGRTIRGLAPGKRGASRPPSVEDAIHLLGPLQAGSKLVSDCSLDVRERVALTIGEQASRAGSETTKVVWPVRAGNTRNHRSSSLADEPSAGRSGRGGRPVRWGRHRTHRPRRPRSPGLQHSGTTRRSRGNRAR